MSAPGRDILRFDTVLFDLDGTLLYTLPDIREAVNHTMRAYGWPEHTMEETRGFIGNGVRKLLERAMPSGAVWSDEIFRCYEDYYAVHGSDHVTVYPGVREMLAALRKRGVRTGVVTNKTHPSAAAMIDAFFGPTMEVTEGKRPNRPAKPAPEAVWDAMAALDAVRERTLYVGDSGVDAQTAASAGIACVLAAWGYWERERLERCEAMAVIDRPEELMEYFGD